MHDSYFNPVTLRPGGLLSVFIHSRVHKIRSAVAKPGNPVADAIVWYLGLAIDDYMTRIRPGIDLAGFVS